MWLKELSGHRITVSKTERWSGKAESLDLAYTGVQAFAISSGGAVSWLALRSQASQEPFCRPLCGRALFFIPTARLENLCSHGCGASAL
jgi:hypothetical protein